MLRNLLILCTLIALAGIPRAECRENELRSPSPQTTPEVTPTEIHNLVEQLGSALYLEREAASERLLKIGSAASEALAKALDHSSAEIRHRAERLIILIEEKEFENRIKRFEQDIDGTQNASLPAWNRFRERFGDGKQLRLFFANMYRTEPDLMKSYEKSKEQAVRTYAIRSQAALQSLQGRTSIRTEPAIGTIAALLMIASDLEIDIPENHIGLLYSLVQRNPMINELKSGRNKVILREMLSNWIKRDIPQNSSYAYQSVMIAMRFDLDAGLQPALKIAKHKSASTYYRFFALLAVAKLGDQSNIPDIQPLLKNKDACYTYRIGKKNVSIQLRDGALAACIYLVGKHPKEFGYKYVQANELYIFNPNSLAFETDKDRQAAMKKWQTHWSKLQEEAAAKKKQPAKNPAS